MVAENTLTTFSGALKQLYRGKVVENLTYPGNRLLGLMPKFTGFVGKNMPIPIIYGNPQGRSATFATAQSNKTAMLVESFDLTRTKNYALASIDGELMDATEGDLGAFLSATSATIEGAMRELSNDIGRNLYLRSYGTRGVVGSESTVTLTLSNAEDANNFEVGQEICSMHTLGTPLDSGDACTITAIDRDAGTLTSDESWATKISGLDAGDYLYVSGDANAKMSGLADWIPSSAPSSADYYGVNRSVDVVRLGGNRVTGTGGTIEEALIDAAVVCASQGGAPDYAFVSFTDWRKLQKTLQSRAVIVNGRRDGISELQARGGNGKLIPEIGYEAIVLNGPSGPIYVLPDQGAPVARGYVLTMSSWVLASLGEVPRLLARNGSKYVIESASDGCEVRAGAYLNAGCSAPGWNATVSFPS